MVNSFIVLDWLGTLPHNSIVIYYKTLFFRLCIVGREDSEDTKNHSLHRSSLCGEKMMITEKEIKMSDKGGKKDKNKSQKQKKRKKEQEAKKKLDKQSKRTP